MKTILLLLCAAALFSSCSSERVPATRTSNDDTIYLIDTLQDYKTDTIIK